MVNGIFLNIFHISSFLTLFLNMTPNMGLRNFIWSVAKCNKDMATYMIVGSLTRRAEEACHKFPDNFFTFTDLFDNLHTITTNCCGISDKIIKGYCRLCQ
jgi:hypothetical protein